MSSYNHSYSSSFTSISSILRDQRELELNPIITATQRANLEATQSVAEFQSNLVKDQVRQWQRRDRNDLKQQYADNIKIMAALPADDPMIRILEAENKGIIEQLS